MEQEGSGEAQGDMLGEATADVADRLGPGVAHLATELLKDRAKVTMQHVSCKGSGPLTADLVGGQLPVGVISIVAAQPSILAGQLNGLAVTSIEHWVDLPELPTVVESGFPGYDYSAWMGVLGRKGMPAADLADLERQLLSVGANDEVRLKLIKQGIVQAPLGHTDFKAAIARDAILNRDLDDWRAAGLASC